MKIIAKDVFALQVVDLEDGPEVCVILKQPGSTACFSFAPQVTPECSSADELDETIDSAIAELQQIRTIARELLRKG